jgi:hypothetical protein
MIPPHTRTPTPAAVARAARRAERSGTTAAEMMGVRKKTVIVEGKQDG